jgi:hypothetical protein
MMGKVNLPLVEWREEKRGRAKTPLISNLSVRYIIPYFLHGVNRSSALPIELPDKNKIITQS